MSIPADKFEQEEPPNNPAAILAGRLSQALLLILCGSPIAIFAFALAHRVFRHFFS